MSHRQRDVEAICCISALAATKLATIVLVQVTFRPKRRQFHGRGKCLQNMRFDREKFKRLVQYVSWQAGKRDWFGATKLNKVLWFSDTRAYALTGSPITGATYIREKHGPVPKAIMPIRSELIREGAAYIVNQGRADKLVSDTKPDMDVFTTTELAIVDWWIKDIAENHTATSISAYSHDYTWHVAQMGEIIPMEATFATSLRNPTNDELRRGKEIAAELGLP